MEGTKLQCVPGKEWQGASSACHMYYKFQTGPLGTTACSWDCCTQITVLLMHFIPENEGSSRALLVTLGATGDPWLTFAIHLTSKHHSSMAAKLCHSLGRQCVSWPLLGQSWLSWCSEVTFPQSWVNKLQCWKTPGAWLRQWLQEPFGVKRQPR